MPGATWGGRWLTRPGSAASLNPDVVLIHLGTNDILQRWDSHRFRTRDGRVNLAVLDQRRTFVIDLTARLSDLLLRIHVLRPHATLVVATAVPIDLPGYAEAVADYAASVRLLVDRLRARGLPIALADASLKSVDAHSGCPMLSSQRRASRQMAAVAVPSSSRPQRISLSKVMMMLACGQTHFTPLGR